ncbi:MAG: hypothetical protein LIP03_06425 [Bacteroidales bacterium]|nr:hypothetical protein [Bacteroidales bacterium]
MNNRFINPISTDTSEEVISWFGFLPSDVIKIEPCDVTEALQNAKNLLLLTVSDFENGSSEQFIHKLDEQTKELDPNLDFFKGKKYIFLFCYSNEQPLSVGQVNILTQLTAHLNDADILWGASPQKSDGKPSIKIAVAYS